MTESLPSGAGADPVTEAAASTEIQDVNQSSSVPSTVDDKGAEGPKSVLDAVTSALKTDKAAGDSPTSKTDPNVPGKAPAETDALSDRPDSAEMNSYHSRTRRRVKQLLDRADHAQAELGKLQPLANQARQINDFVSSSGLTWEEVNSGFGIMKMMKTDPFAAREALAPMMDALNKACGVELPADLRQKVDQGFVDEATARDLAQSKARAHFATRAQAQTVEQVQERQQVEAHQRHVGSVTSAVKGFQESWLRTDPDAAAKMPLVMEKVELTLSRLARAGQTITDPAHAVKIVEDAKKAVEASFKPYLRKVEAINPLPSGTVSATAGAKPKSMAEAIARSLTL